MVKKVAILLASYNGEEYIGKQIESIIRQTYKEWQLFIRDDGSMDSTKEIIKQYCAKDARVHLVMSDSRDYHGPFINFHYLINHIRTISCFDYYYYCDQDDIWLDNKIEVMNNCFNKKGTPELLYSDMTIIDENDTIIVQSNNADRGIRLPNNKQLYFTHSYIWGCAVAFNRQLFELVPPVNIERNIDIVAILSHDNFFAKFALEYGQVTYVDKCLIKYRRHSNNVSTISKSKVGIKDILSTAVSGYSRIAALHANGYSQTLFTIDIARKNGLYTKKLDEIETVIQSGGWRGLNYLIKNKIKKKQLAKTLAMYIVFLLGSYKRYLIRIKE